MNARPSDVSTLNELGRNQLYRGILTGILKARGLVELADPQLVTKAVEQGQGLQLVRHLEALKRAGGGR